MSAQYQAVLWNRQKKRYDLALAGGLALYLLLFIAGGAVLHPNATAETLLIRGFATAAFLLLHVILSIGPLCRLNPRFLPLLYNRRHLGVSMFILALAHGILSLIQFHVLGSVNPLVSLLSSSTPVASLSDLPFQPLGFAALAILFLMAATSHDFWLANLSAPVWKTLHMLVYAAYVLIIAHIALGVLQVETSPLLLGLVTTGMLWLLALHLLAARKEKPLDQQVFEAGADGFIQVCTLDDIPEKRAFIASIGGERVALFKYDGKLSALSNVCQHQNGPLGEGRVIDGLITCPWHGYQYRPHDGSSPEPFREKVPTFRLRLLGKNVYIHPQPNRAGTPVEPLTCND